MKNILCYLGIILLIALILFPPILRITLPDREKIKQVVTEERIILSCSNSEYIANTSYNNQNIEMIAIKKIINENIEDSITGDKFVKVYDSLREKGDVVLETTDDGEILKIDFSVSDNKGLNLVDLTKNVDEQKIFYEEQNFSCIVRK